MQYSVEDGEWVVDGRVVIVHRCASLGEAEAWIAEREKTEPAKVHRGAYGINVPESEA